MLFQNRVVTVFFYACLTLAISCFWESYFAKRPSLHAREANFSTPINPEEYIIGPGDRFRIDFWDGSSEALELTVTPEGSVLLTAMGKVDVGGLTLMEAKQRLRNLIGSFFTDVDFSVSLMGVRPVKVLVTGGVKKPGLYDGLVSQRVSEIIKKAGGLIGGASRRNIRVASGDKTRTVDLLRFERVGDLDANPYLYLGNKVHVPLVVDSSAFMQISGEVASPGGLEYKDGDNLSSVIDLSLGFTGLEGDSIYIFRGKDASPQPIVIQVSKLDFPVMPGDKIIVNRTSKDLTADYYSITGEINMPGRYPYQIGLNLNLALKTAAGLTRKADIYSLTVYRKTEFKWSLEAVNMPNTNNLSFSADRLPASLRITEFYPDRLDEIAIFPGDSIVIPVRTGSIGIYGMVNRPGFVEYDRPAKASSLIQKAGGYSRNADRGIVQVIRKSSGIKITTSPNIEIYDGDTVIIPVKEQRNSLWDKLKDISLILGGMGIVYLAIDNIAD